MKAKTKNLGMLVLISLVIIGLYIESCQRVRRNPSLDQNNLQFPPATEDTLTWRDSLEDVQAQVANEKGTHCLINLYEDQNWASLAPRGSSPPPCIPKSKSAHSFLVALFSFTWGVGFQTTAAKSNRSRCKTS